MTNIRKFKNYDSDIHALLAYELAIEAQNIIYAMAAISAITPRPYQLRPENPSFRWAMDPVGRAMMNEAMASAGHESSPSEW